MLTTGDVAAFRATAERLFGDDFAAVEAVNVTTPGGVRVAG
jgi:hypothetical protein